MAATGPAPRRILVGTDFSSGASRAVVRAAMLAVEHGAQLQIVHAWPRRDGAGVRRPGLGRLIEEQAGHAVEEELGKASALARAHGVAATCRLLAGAPAAALVREAARSGADLVVVARRGQRSQRGHVIGTTAERLAERCRCDVLVVQAVPTSPYARVVACLGLAPVSCAVVRAALRLSAGGRLYLLHAYEPPFELTLLSHDLDEATLAGHERATRQEAARAVEALLGRCPLPAGRRAEVILWRGRAADVIPMNAARLGADVVAVGRNQSPLRALFLGSATKHALRDTPVDVLVCAAPGREGAGS